MAVYTTSSVGDYLYRAVVPQFHHLKIFLTGYRQGLSKVFQTPLLNKRSLLVYKCQRTSRIVISNSSLNVRNPGGHDSDFDTSG